MAEPIIGNTAHYQGEDRPRCKARPRKADMRPDMVMAGGVWGCALPQGHEDFEEPRHRPHSWIQTEVRT